MTMLLFVCFLRRGIEMILYLCVCVGGGGSKEIHEVKRELTREGFAIRQLNKLKFKRKMCF